MIITIENVEVFDELPQHIADELKARLSWAVLNSDAYGDEFNTLTISAICWVDELPAHIAMQLDCGGMWFLQATDDGSGVGYVGMDNGSGTLTGTANAYFWTDGT